MTTYPDVAAPGGAPGAPEPVSATRVDWAPVPRVNLLPPEIVEARSLGRLKKVLGGALVVVLASCAGAVAWAQSGVASAQAGLDAAQARTAILRTQQAKYAQVPRILALIDSAAAAREQAMRQDVLWYGFLSDLSMTTPKGVLLENLEMTMSSGTTTATAADPLTPSGIGQVTFSGTAQHFPDVAAWLEAVGTVHGLDGSTLQTAARNPGTGGSTTGGDGITFTSTIQVTSKALTHRYDRKAD
ncbi:MAG TPA: PilN domain-containing protein [Kineosporiaceae bacterium]|nr:PilN domain-containing protein [Kineosporiaceae bacterium]